MHYQSAFLRYGRLVRALALSCFLCACGGQSGADTSGAHAASAFTSVNSAPNGGSSSYTPFTSVRLESTASTAQSAVPITFGQVFAQGDVPASSSLTASLSDGTIVPLQVDVKATHPDGSIRHAVLSAVVSGLQAGQTKRIDLARSGVIATAGSTPQALLNAGFTANVSVNVGGVTYSASADSLLQSGSYLTWLAGSVANEWIVSAPLKTSGGVEHPHLHARFAVRSYTGLNRAKVDVIVENDWAYVNGPQNFTYDLQINVGGQNVYSKAALTHYHHARWRKSFWWGAAPQAHIKHDTAYLIASRAVPNYDQSVTILPATLTAIRTRFSGANIEPMASGMAIPYMPQTGGRPDIGLLPGWTVSYLLSMDKDAKEATLGTADLGGSWSAHYRDKNTNRPISLKDYPYMTIVGHASDTFNPATSQQEMFPACGGDCTNPNQPDTAHEPGLAYLPYLVSGEHYYLEELQFWTMWNLFYTNPGYRNNIQGLIHPNQVRAQAWNLRTLAQAAYIMPDNDVFKAQFAQFLSNNLDWYNSTYSNNSNPNNTLGAIVDDNALVYDSNLSLSPWQDDFFTQAAGHAAELGFAKARPLLAWKAKFPVGRMVDPGFCWILGSIYTIHMRDTVGGPFYTTFGQAYQASNPPALASLACGSAAMAANLGLGVGEMVGYANQVQGYPANMQPALAYSADSQIAGAANAWNVFMARSAKPDYGNGAQFAIVPR